VLGNYVNVRRHFIFLKHSIDEGTQWAVFKPKAPSVISAPEPGPVAFCPNFQQLALPNRTASVWLTKAKQHGQSDAVLPAFARSAIPPGLRSYRHSSYAAGIGA
jgi:hypothetical protein